MIEDRIWMLLARKLTGVATLREAYELEKFMFENPEDQSSIRIIMTLWRKRDEVTTDPEAERKFIELLKKAYEEEVRHSLLKFKKKNKFF